MRADAKRNGWSDKQLFRREVDVATNCFRGVDKDSFLAKVCKAYMATVGDGRGGVFCATLWPGHKMAARASGEVQAGLI